MKRTILLLSLVFMTLVAACQAKDKLFTAPVWLQGGFYVGADPVLHLTLPSGGSTAWSAITGKPTTLSGYGITDAALATHNHSSLYKPLSYVPTWSEILSKPTFATVATTGSFTDLVNVPEMMELDVAIPLLDGLRLPVLTAAEIAALTPVKGLLLWNDTDNVLQIYNGSVWKIVISGN